MKRCSVLLALAMSCAVSAGIGQEKATVAQEPVTPDAKEVAAHVIGEVPTLRMDLSKYPLLQMMREVQIEVSVDEHGAVTAAGLDGADGNDDSEIPKQYRRVLLAVTTEVRSAAMQMHFHPFEHNGQAVPAKFEIRMPVRSLEERVTKHVPFPPIHEWNLVKVVLSRSGCLGTCPSYRVEVHGDGTVLYEGNGFVAITGQHRGSVSRAAVMQMIEAFRAADYYSLKDRYAWAATDCPTYTTSISIDGKSKEISDYVGEKVGMPESVTKVEEAIDSFSGVERWTKGNSETVSALEQEKFDFKSTEASEILVNVAKRGNADAVRDLVASGVPVAKPTPDRFSSTALENAAKRGDTDMIQALLSAGINDTEMKTRALAEAASAGKVDGMLLLIEYGANPIAPEVLIGAARSGVPEIVQQILQYKPNVNGRGPNQQPPLLAAISAYHNEDAAIDVEGVVRILLDADCDPNLADKKGMTPLIANARDAEIAEMLIAHGANVNAQANDGFTPLMNAGTAELTRLLLEHGANPFAKSKRGETALDWAKQTGKNKQAAILEAAMTGKHQ